MILVSKFKNTNDIYENINYFWQYGRYQQQYQINKTGKKVVLYNNNTNEILAIGIKNINKYMQINNLKVER